MFRFPAKKELKEQTIKAWVEKESRTCQLPNVLINCITVCLSLAKKRAFQPGRSAELNKDRPKNITLKPEM